MLEARRWVTNMNEFYQMTVEEIRNKLSNSLSPLTDEQVLEHQKKYGKNQLMEEKKKNVFQIFLEQFKDFLVIILIIAAAVSGFLGDIESAIVILVVITINGILGTVQTVKAEQSLKSLKALSGPEAKVLRNGNIIKIKSDELTIGDEVYLEAGDYVPADGRIIDAATIKVDESMLTGESLPVEKNQGIISEKVPLGDRCNMVFSGSFVTYGRGSFIVTNIGMDTEVGKIAKLLKSTSEKKTPLQVSLDQFGQRLSIIILAFCALLFGLSVFRGESIGNAFLFAVALAVAAIPEALSSIVTIVLSFGAQKMAREHAIIRKLQAVEGLGSISIICSDKTGTLTQNKMTIEDWYSISDNMDKLYLYGILCNDASIIDGKQIGDPTEVAFVDFANKNGISVEDSRKQFKRICEVPFDSDRKLMSTIHNINGKNIMITKGATDVVLQRATHIEINKEVREINKEYINLISKQNIDFSKEGLRVLTIAYKEFDSEKEIDLSDEYNLTFLGLAAMMDPPRVESKDAVTQCKLAGIKPIMITGDHRITASAIAKKIGILESEEESCEGSAIDGLSDEDLMDFVKTKSVYARVSPEHKIRIVNAWQNNGNIVAMTGDGVNDAPALKQADTGVAMGITGSEVSKDAASIVLTDDNFATIVKAVENGRNMFRNIKNSIKFLLSGNFGGILVVLFASIAALPVPFAPVHLLFINLMTDSLPAIALGLEKHSKDVMKDKPRNVSESILTKDYLINIAIGGLVIGTMTIIAFIIGLNIGNLVLAQTMAFSTLCIGRLFHGFNCKSDKPVLFTRKFFDNKYLIGAFFAGILMTTCVVTLNIFENVFSVKSLTFTQLLIVYGLAAMNLFIVQIIKFVRSIIKK